jgi:hypothetical protein
MDTKFFLWGLVAIAAYQLFVSVRVLNSPGHSGTQKFVQLFIIWVLPFIGALTCEIFLSLEDRSPGVRNTTSAPDKGESQPEIGTVVCQRFLSLEGKSPSVRDTASALDNGGNQPQMKGSMKFISYSVDCAIIAAFSYVGIGLSSITMGTGHFEVDASSWFIAFVVFCPIGMWLWRDESRQQTWDEWAGGAIGSFMLGALFFVIDIIGGRFMHPEMGLFSAATHMYAFPLTILVCPFATFLCIASAVRTYIVGKIEITRLTLHDQV